MATKVRFINQKEDKRSYDIEVTTDRMGNAIEPFIIPVVDVRDGEDARRKANSILKASKANTPSKYLKPSFGAGGGSYNGSYKK